MVETVVVLVIWLTIATIVACGLAETLFFLFSFFFWSVGLVETNVGPSVVF